MSAIADLTLAEGFEFHRQTKLSLADLNQMVTYPILRSCRDAIRQMSASDVGEAIRDGIETDDPATAGIGDQVASILRVAASRTPRTALPTEDHAAIRAKAIKILETEQMIWEWEDFMRAIACVTWLHQRRSNPTYTYEQYLESKTTEECLAEFYALTAPVSDTPSEGQAGPLDGPTSTSP